VPISGCTHCRLLAHTVAGTEPFDGFNIRILRSPRRLALELTAAADELRFVPAVSTFGFQGTPMTFQPASGFPLHRPRRLRGHPRIRDLVSETRLSIDNLIYPLFVYHGKNLRREIVSMPGQYQLSLDRLGDAIGEVAGLGIPAILLFGIPERKDAVGSAASRDDGIVQEAIRVANRVAPDLLVITDLCFCEYTDHGHCGPLKEVRGRWDVDNDATLPLLAAQAVSHARAGADMIAPSGMMDGMVQAIRRGLDDGGFLDIPILAYAAKFASGYYGPFRDAAESAPSFGDRRTYQMDPGNAEEALREVALDLAEGADLVMVKPALAYLDIIHRVKTTFSVPVAAYNVSGEYAMIKAAAANGWVDERRIVLETLTGMKRAGADMILTYHAPDVARWLRQG
jgi:porphobilinogen synthase